MQSSLMLVSDLQPGWGPTLGDGVVDRCLSDLSVLWWGAGTRAKQQQASHREPVGSRPASPPDTPHTRGSVSRRALRVELRHTTATCGRDHSLGTVHGPAGQ